jgi:hypothetical protein
MSIIATCDRDRVSWLGCRMAGQFTRPWASDRIIGLWAVLSRESFKTLACRQ